MNTDILTVDGIRRYLGKYGDIFNITIEDTVTSTNAVLKSKAPECSEGELLIARLQTSGHGRFARKFHSPVGGGIYMSLLLKPRMAPENALKITTAAAVAVAEAIEVLTDGGPKIKWVNDVYFKDKKVCGILTEGAVNTETKLLDWAVLGIGINVYPPENGFAEDIKNIAGAVNDTRRDNLLNRLTAETLKRFWVYYKNLEQSPHLEAYQSRSYLNGKAVKVLKGDSSLDAVAISVDGEFKLLVTYPDGTTEHLNSGEVSIKPI